MERSNTAGRVVIYPAKNEQSTTSAAGSFVEIRTYAKPNIPTQKAPASKKIENAVYGYARAMRSLDRKKITVSEISSALSIPERDVIKALGGLTKKGVKIPK